MDTKNKLFTVIGTVAILATAGIGGYTLFTSQDATDTSTATTSSQSTTDIGSSGTSSTTDSTTVAASGSYKDGTYTVSQNYMVPKGSNSIGVTIVVANGAITSVSTTNEYNDHESGMYIDSFESSISMETVGKSLSGLSLSRVGGASLTTDGFNAALDTIRTQASA